jgi:hypothetical protein
MKKKEVQKELNRLGFDVELHDKPLTPDLPEGLMAVDNMKLRLTPEKEAELAERERERRESPEPTGSAVPAARISTVTDMIRQQKPRDYSVKKVLDCVTTYVIEGTFRAVERIHGVPYQTIQDWEKRYPWFNEVVNYVKNTTDHELESRMTTIVNKSTDIILDRLENGDYGDTYWDDEKEEWVETRKQISIDQAARVGAIWFDKRQIARGMDVKNQTTMVQTVEDKLRAIASRMQEIAESMPEGKIINITPTRDP